MSHPNDWALEYDGAMPPLPPQFKEELGSNSLKILKEGAYLIWIDPKIARESHLRAPRILVGTLRVKHGAKVEPAIIKNEVIQLRSSAPDDNDNTVTWVSGSGDLYSLPTDPQNIKRRFTDSVKSGGDILKNLQLPRSNYKYYLALTVFFSPKDSKYLTLGFQTFGWDGRENGWQPRRSLTVNIEGKVNPEKTYIVSNNIDTHVARMGLIHIGNMFRHATISTHYVGIDAPERSPWEDSEWKNALEHAGWEVDLKPVDTTYEIAEDSCEHKTKLSDEFKIYAKKRDCKDKKQKPKDKKQNFKEDEPEPWTRYALNSFHEKFIDDRVYQYTDSGKEVSTEPWEYHLLMVDRIQYSQDSYPSGLMYDVGDRGPNDSPRRGAAIAHRYKDHGDRVYQRTAKILDWTGLHELGHMQGLYHNPSSTCLMQPEPPHVDNDSNAYKHADIDVYRLMHFPDLWVRPGGVPFGYRYRASALEVLELIDEDRHLLLEVAPLTAVVGSSPPELILTLENRSPRGILCPNNRHVQPSYGRIGIRFHTPSGQWLEVSPVHFPRRLGGLGNTSLLALEKIKYRIPWHKSWPALRQPGHFGIYVDLLWYVSSKERGRHVQEEAMPPHGEDPKIELQPDRSPGPAGHHEIHRVSAIGDLRVTSK